MGRASRVAPATARLQALAHPLHRQSELLEGGLARTIRPHQSQDDVLRAYRVVLQPNCLGTSAFEDPLGTGAQRVGIHAGRRSFLAQSGFASSTSMMGMPSSTG